MEHIFHGKWVTDSEFSDLRPLNVFHRQLEKVTIDTSKHRNCHILFRKAFTLQKDFQKVILWVTADDYVKLYVNGSFAGQGPAPAYPFQYGYLQLDITDYCRPGRNVLAFHTYYQGLINRVWVSGDCRQGLLCDVEADGKIVCKSGQDFLTCRHRGYSPLSVVGYETQFMECFDANAPEVGFQAPDFDDSSWEQASLRKNLDYTLIPQKSKSLDFEQIEPVSSSYRGNRLFLDFGKTYVGTLCISLRGKKGDKVSFYYGQEETDEGVRYQLRANCLYRDEMLLSGGEDSLDQYDYKSFRYVEIQLPQGVQVETVFLRARHYPFTLKVSLKPAYKGNPELERIWALGVNSLKYGVQEVIQDCMEREKGFYVGDGCYTSLAHFILTGDDSIVRKLIDDAFASSFITPGLVTCLDCSFMQEIAEYPLIMISLILWHYRLTGDRDYLAHNYPRVCELLETYRDEYERDGLIGNLDKWCVVDWPANFRDGYDVDITEGKVCVQPHVALNAYYIEAIEVANTMASILSLPLYRDKEGLKKTFIQAFYDEEAGLFWDSRQTDHHSFIGNIFPFAFELCPDKARQNILAWIRNKKIEGVSFFGSFLLLEGLIRQGYPDLVKEQLLCQGAWLRMLREGATTTYEGWGRDTKWNTSLFHLTMSDVVVFLSDIDHANLFKNKTEI